MVNLGPKRKEWKIMDMHPEAIAIIKARAKDLGYTIPKYLQYVIAEMPAEPITRNPDKSWTISGLDKETINKIKDNATKENKTVANYIKGLLALERTVVRQDRVKAELTKKLKGIVKELLDRL